MSTVPPLVLGGALLGSRVHPMAVLNILDAHMRRPMAQERVIGTLLGRVENGVAVVTDSFPVPHNVSTRLTEDGDSEERVR